MLTQIALSTGGLRPIARSLKAGFDDLQEADSGWWYVRFDHPAWGREDAASVAERIPGTLVVSSTEPGDDADALVVVVGYVDSFTDEVHLGNGMVVPATSPEERASEEDASEDYPNRRMPAVALFEENGLQALIGSVRETREPRFELVSLGETVDAAIREWLEDVATGK